MSVILNQLKKEATIFCPLCNLEYKPTNMKVVENAGDTILAHSECPTCKGALLSLLYRDFLGLNLVGLVTDLNYDDALRIKAGKTVSDDDVLRVYNKLMLRKYCI